MNYEEFNKTENKEFQRGGAKEEILKLLEEKPLRAIDILKALEVYSYPTIINKLKKLTIDGVLTKKRIEFQIYYALSKKTNGDNYAERQ
jgi:predicted transcriptional regulator